ncbi:MAG: hypothetical protein HC922_02975 [Leptolyngbyaceae cyanobacterium SM2_3_12]|nr:hypothetical protein [Leptolyngbyaceae cyanobacterium SM2_3_12]
MPLPPPHSIFRSHLQEVWAQLRQNPEVLAAWRRVVEGEGVPLDAINSMRLESLGLIEIHEQLAYPLCDLYQYFFAIQWADSTGSKAPTRNVTSPEKSRPE